MAFSKRIRSWRTGRRAGTIALALVVTACMWAGCTADRSDSRQPLSGSSSETVPASADDQREFIKGVYGNPGALLEHGYRFDELGMNAIFIRSISLNDEIYRTAREQGMQVHVEFPTLLGRGYVQEHPDAWPIDQNGEPSPPADWFMGVCPTHPGFIAMRDGQLHEIMDRYSPDGIFLDYLHWHAQFETPDPILPETCFCDRCTAQFEQHAGIAIPYEATSQRARWILDYHEPAWRAWRHRVLMGWVERLGDIVSERSDHTKLGAFFCSWFPDDYQGALYRTLGLDIPALSERVDVLSPMLFHKMKNREPEWVGTYNRWLAEEVFQGMDGQPPLVWPIVQAHNAPTEVTPAEFRQVMRQGASPPATGIMMFSDVALIVDSTKVEVMRQLYSNEF